MVIYLMLGVLTGIVPYYIGVIAWEAVSPAVFHNIGGGQSDGMPTV